MGSKLNKTVFVGVSGGVDSSVSAALLKDQGYDVVGVFIRTWQPEFIECTWRDERRDAMRVCAHLDIPFLECDAEEAYKKGVADYMIEEYKKGNTPNPDVMCNREVKFGVFWNFAKAHGADYIATGHYARVLRSESSSQSSLTPSRKERDGTPPPVAFQGLSELHKGNDESKDQSYFLWTLTQDDLSHTLFPIGHLQKSQVRKLAEKFGLPTAEKKDSQGVCFLGPLDMKEFLAHYIKPVRGDVLNEKGEIVGYHNGVVFFTLGERHGFTITKHSTKNLPLYVVAKDIEKNIIIVSQNKNFTAKDTDNSLLGISSARPSRPAQVLSQQDSCFTLKNINWISDIPKENKKYTAQIRYHGEQLPCRFKNTSITFDRPVLASLGQSIVVYDGDICLGGGIVE
ncbi:MAG: tRNA 2-thiouridine(34) synthase MnmA [Patescibacteria group bacterium]